MSVSLAQIRTHVADRPQIWPPMASEPEIIGIGDGVATIFSLQFENYISGTLTVYQATAPAPGQTTTFAAVSATQYTVGGSSSSGTAATNAIITFNAAPAAGTLIAARYQATAFSDADLQTYLDTATSLYADDGSVKSKVLYDLIPVILADQRRLEMLAEGDSKKDRAAYINGLLKLRDSLRADFANAPQPGADVPAISFNGVAVTQRYEPFR